jgi:hypothetical protein
VDLIGPTCSSTTELEAWVPKDTIAGYYDVAVINDDGQSDALGNAYTATNPIPSISGLSPAASIWAASEVVTVTSEQQRFRNTGTPGNLRGALDGVTTTVTYISTDMVTVVVPPSLPRGVYTLTITNPGPTDPTFSLTNSLAVVLTYTTTCQPAPLCQVAIGPPDGDFYRITDTEGITIDFGSAGIDHGPGYDMVFYEFPSPPGIRLDYVTIELSNDGTTWYPVFDWDGVDGGVTGTNIDSYAVDSGTYAGEYGEEPIPGSVLYPGAPYPYGNSGIAIDIAGLIPVSGPFRWVRVFYPPDAPPAGGNRASQVDSIVRLN